MSMEVKMPKLGLTMTEGTVVRWLKEEGDSVEGGEPLFEVETDKVVMEVEAPEHGVLQEILVGEGGTVQVTEPIAILTRPGEGEGDHEAKPAAGVKVTPVAKRVAEAHGVDLSGLEGSGSRGRITADDVRGAIEVRESAPAPSRVRASWRARSVAESRGIDLSALAPGRGPQGRVVEKDVLEAVASRAEEPTEARDEPEPAGWEPLSHVESVTAERMERSFSTVPHFYLTVEVDAQELLRLRRALMEPIQKRAAVRLTISDLLVKAAASALREHPRVNGAWGDGRVKFNPAVNVGLATATERGLVVPVIEHADRKSLPEIAAARADLTTRAREGRLKVDEVGHSSFTLTNLGAYGIDQFQPIINAPESSILAVGQIKERPAGLNGELALRPTVFLTLACDHRVLDGARAAGFLRRVTALIEEPYALLAAGGLLDGRGNGHY